MEQEITDFIEEYGAVLLVEAIKSVYFKTDELTTENLHDWLSRKFENNYHSSQFETFVYHTLHDLDLGEK